MSTASSIVRAGQPQVLERAEADARDHQVREHQDHARHHARRWRSGRGWTLCATTHHQHQHAGRGRDARPEGVFARASCPAAASRRDSTLKRARRIAPGADVEAGEEDPQPSEAGQPPLVDHDGGRDAEGDGVGQRVEVAAEVGLRLGQPRDPAVGRVEEEAEADGQRGLVEIARPSSRRRRQRDGDEPAEDAREREEVRKNVVGLPEVHGEKIPWLGPVSPHDSEATFVRSSRLIRGRDPRSGRWSRCCPALFDRTGETVFANRPLLVAPRAGGARRSG